MKPWALALAAILITGADQPGQGQGGKNQAQDPPGVVRMSAEQQRTVKLQTARATRRPITEVVRVAGTVGFDEQQVAVIRPLAPSLVVQLLARPGDTVQPGQTLADLEIPTLLDAQDSLGATKASVTEAEAGVAVARDALHRGEILARDGSLARAEAERRRLVLAQAQAAADAARARLATLNAQIKRLNPGIRPGTATLVSPIGGTVVTAALAPGELTAAAGSAFMVADLSVMWVQAQIPEASASLVAAGDDAHVELLTGGNRSWDGKIVALGAAIDSQARTLPARIQIVNADGTLRAGMAVQVSITSDRGRDNVVVPPTAVQLVGDKRVAFTPLGDGRFQSHELQLGLQQPDFVEVQHGLSAGEEVVTQGSFELKAVLQQSMLGGAG